ncbi:hypothetical protein JCM19045_4044 [Bacillus sp. JCM 19045]|uniref:Uncharacterized protein n=1 Tax=Shouchella xiaoxiensis TaxID=766895 RepID=A0ABS2SVY7_9BACI|nr:hypothetical protein [Shouchella xiaoxiensis]MBM7839704.1 hypothetical protein [Shouchella xiaoxiensis]GAF14715.1 hypothetical protein JCM19045_4044 [Bacillus sp. JCM 19045]
MKKQQTNFAKQDEELLSDEMYIALQELEEELDAYLVNYPNSEQIQATIETLQQYAPAKERLLKNWFSQGQTLIERASIEIFYMSRRYWLLTIAFFIVGYLITIETAHHPILSLIMLAPAPFVFGLLEIIKGREHGLLEMEMSCKWSAHTILYARLLVISLFTVLVNTLFMLSSTPIIDAAQLFSLILSWFVPLTLFCAIAFYLSMKLRRIPFLVSFLAIWFVFCGYVLLDPIRSQVFLSLHISLYLFTFLTAILLFTLQLKHVAKQYQNFEKSDPVETSY